MHNSGVDPYNGEPPHVAGSDTSIDARDGIRESVNALQARVLGLLAFGPQTDEEMQIDGGMIPSTQRPRRIELCELGLVCDSGARRRTSRGRSAVVWQLHRATCTCKLREPRQTARPQAQSIGPVATPSSETMRIALENLSALWRANPERFSSQLVEVLRWLRVLSI